jgi:WD repeat-containing protein 7
MSVEGTTASNKQRSKTLWRSSTLSGLNGSLTTKSTPKVNLTSVLPLELNTIILGYGPYLPCFTFHRAHKSFFIPADGRLRQLSLAQMLTPGHLSPGGLGHNFVKVSDFAIGGSILTLHLVRNTRTRERFVVGGGDDGSISFWHAESALSYYCFTL